MPKKKLSDILQETCDPKEQLIMERSFEYLDGIAQKFCLPVDEWGVIEWKAVARVAIFEKLSNEFDLGIHTKISKELFAKYKEGRKLANHTENRKDQIDKRNFQNLVKTNREEYKTKADAIRDLRANEKFADYPDATLRSWITEAVWGGKGVHGRPRKIVK